MDLFFPILFLIIGFVLIIKGGDLFVDSAVWLAKKTGLPEIVVGATVVSVGTTIPEILVSVIAVIKGLADPLEVQAYSELAIGNAVGSMLCNIALILSIVLIVRPPKTEGRSFNEKGIALIFVTMLFMVFALTGNVIVPIEGVILLVAFVAFLTLNYYDAKRDMILNKDLSCVSDAKAKANEQNSFLMISLFIIGAAAIGIGAYLLVDKGQELALMLGVPSQVIAITVLAIGTSLPELVTSLTSLRKGTCEMGLGNIIGANVINSTLLLGLISVISGVGVPIDSFTKNFAIWALLGISLILIIPAILKKKTMRWQGYVMLAIYLGFISFNIIYVL